MKEKEMNEVGINFINIIKLCLMECKVEEIKDEIEDEDKIIKLH